MWRRTASECVLTCVFNVEMRNQYKLYHGLRTTSADDSMRVRRDDKLSDEVWKNEVNTTDRLTLSSEMTCSAI